LGNLHGDGDGPATDTAILDVFLATHRAVDEDLDLLTAIRALKKC
jgi:anti-sigma factor RsiW